MINKTDIFLLFLLVMSFISSAHPHVFIDVSVYAGISENKFDTLKIVWFFDDMFSVIFAEEYDKNQDGIYDTAEIEIINSTVFAAMGDYNYYTKLWLNGNEYNFKPKMSIDPKTEILIFTFDVDLNINLKEEKQELKIRVFDDEFYHAIEYKNNAVKFTGGGKSRGSFIKQKAQHDLGYSLVPVIDLVVSF